MAKTAPTRAQNPVPTQKQADEINDVVDETAAVPVAKSRKPDPTPEAPFPTQADLDAMKAGNYANRELKTN